MQQSLVNALPLSLRRKFSKYKKRGKRAGAKKGPYYPFLHAYLMLRTRPLTLWHCYADVLERKEQSEQCPGAESESHSRWRQPTPVTRDIITASNFNREFFLTDFFSRETLLLITVSLSRNEIQVFKDGLEKQSQLIKVDLAPVWVPPPPNLLKARCCYKRNSQEELCLRLKINRVFFPHFHKNIIVFSIKQN